MVRYPLLVLICLPLLLPAQEPAPRPAVGPFGVQNGASFAPAGLFGGSGIAPGSIVVIKGAWLGPDEIALADAPLPTLLAGSQIEIRSLTSGEVFLVPLIHAWAFQLAGVAPVEIPVGPAEVTAIYEGRRSEPVEIAVVETSPALFSLGQTGGGPAVVQNWQSPDSAPLNRFTRPARPGQTVILWGTGLHNADQSRTVRITIGAARDPIEVEPFYAGPAPGLPGVDQINLTLPATGVPEGCLVRVSVAADNVGFGSTTMAIASGDGPCRHPWGLTEGELRTLDEGGQLAVATVHLSDEEPVAINPGLALSPRVSARAQTLLVAFDGLEGLTRGPFQPFANSLFACGSIAGVAVGDFSGGPVEPLPEPPPPDRLPREQADAGEALALHGPDGRTLALELTPSGGPLAPPGSYTVGEPLEPGDFTPGVWRLVAPGGTDIEGFEARMEVPPIPSITPPERIRRDEELHIEWNPAGFREGQAVHVRVAVRVRDDQGGYRVEGAHCRAQATSGGIRIRSEHLARLPEPADGMAVFTYGVVSTTAFDTPALVHGSGSFSASRTAEVAFE